MNSHSPVVLSALAPHGATRLAGSEIFFADQVAIAESSTGVVRRKTRIRPISPDDHPLNKDSEPEKCVRYFEVDRFLDTVNMEG